VVAVRQNLGNGARLNIAKMPVHRQCTYPNKQSTPPIVITTTHWSF
jgi:hypothetical protein